MAGLEKRSVTFEETLCQVLSGLNLNNVFLRVEQKEAIRSFVVSNKDTHIILPTGFGKSLGSLSNNDDDA